jgi:hypothetical protein
MERCTVVLVFMPELQVRHPSVGPPLGISSFERSIGDIDGPSWDAFLQECESSFLGMWSIVRANRFLNCVRVFEFFGVLDGSNQKIGQCAVAINRRIRFLDRIHLLPKATDRWEACMQLVMEACGSGNYEYGSPWNAEDRRPPDGQVGQWVSRPASGRPFMIDRVDFRRWSGFAHYRNEVSENIRRDYRKAVAAGAVLECRRGLAALRDVVTLARMRGGVLRRNGEPFSMALDILRHVVKILCIGDRAFIATVRADGRCYSAFLGVQFGDNVYYIAGGTVRNAHGYGSFLFLTQIEKWFGANPNGKLYLGRQTACIDPAAYTRPNAMYRRKLRATSGPGTAFRIELARPETVSSAPDPALAGDRVSTPFI